MDVIGQLLVSGLILGATYAVVTVGFALIFNIARFFHVMHGAVFTAGAYFAYEGVRRGLPLPVAVLVGMATCALMGIALEVGLHRPLREKGAPSLIFMMASLGLLYVVQNIIAVIWGTDIIRIAYSTGDVTPWQIGPVFVTPMGLATLVAAVVFFVVLWLFLNRTRVGISLKAVGNSVPLAIIVGTDVSRVMVVTLAVGSAAAGLAGILVAMNIGMTPYTGFDVVLLACIAVLIGGVGSLAGAVSGAILLGVIRTVAPIAVSGLWSEFIIFLALFLLMYVRPRGLFGKKVWKSEV